MHGSTNNTFHINGQPFDNRTAAFDASVLQAETIAQSAERGGLKVAQVEWAGGRNAAIHGPTIDFQSFFSGRGVATNFIGGRRAALRRRRRSSQSSACSSTTRPAIAGQAPVPGRRARRRRPAGPACPRRYSPAKEMRLRVLDFGVDKYGLNAYIFDSTNDHRTNYDQRAVLAARKNGADAVGDLRKGQWADVKVRSVGGDARRQDRGHARQGRGADQGPVARPPLPHLGHPRDRVAGRPGRASRASPATSTSSSPEVPDLDGRRLRGPRGGHRQRGDLRRAGPVLGDRPPADARVRRRDVQAGPAAGRHADDRRVPAPVPRPGQPKLPNGAPNPAYDDVDLDGVADHRVAQREGFIRDGLPRGRPTLRLAPASCMGKDPTTFVGSDHGFAPQFLAIDASKVARRPRAALEAADLELPPGRRARRSARPRPAGPAARADLPQPRRAATRPAAASSRWRPPTRPRPSRRSRPRSWR